MTDLTTNAVQAFLAEHRDERMTVDPEQLFALCVARDEACARAAELERALVARHGGEPVALLAELDACRAERDEARKDAEDGPHWQARIAELEAELAEAVTLAKAMALQVKAADGLASQVAVLREAIEQVALEAEVTNLSKWNAPLAQLEGAIEDAVAALADTEPIARQHDERQFLKGYEACRALIESDAAEETIKARDARVAAEATRAALERAAVECETHAALWTGATTGLLRAQAQRIRALAEQPPPVAVEPSQPDASGACATCGKPATCVGRYECMTEPELACDDCCGHGNEDGRCEPVAGKARAGSMGGGR